MKSIRDSVHGSISVEDRFVTTILETPAFQRLRRIEQTAIRSVFPSARHDRFIHSLGVYHIGSLIVKHLEEEFNRNLVDNQFEGYSKTEIDRFFNSYLIACLLHDIAHAPFSHTFELYYGSRSILFNRLNAALGNKLDNELEDVDDPNYHEYASAIAVIEIFKKELIEDYLDGDLELVCRMIIGCKYVKAKETHQLQNCFISLIHGDIIDADRMDYACRDVWASGYSTSTIDVTRIISALHIRRTENSKELTVCFDCNALNEITNMLDIRSFQNRYVINHHSVQYEQKLMLFAAECAAEKLYSEEQLSPSEALSRIVCIDACIDHVRLPDGREIKQISDEDLLSLMKMDDNQYYKEFSSRRYERIAVWKTPDEFYHFFPEILRGVDLKSGRFEEEVKRQLKEKLGIDNIIICKVKYKPTVNLKDLYLVVNGDVVGYTDIHPEFKINLSDSERDQYFYYLFVPGPKGDPVASKDLRESVVKCLTPLLKELYPMTQESAMYERVLAALTMSYKLLGEDRKDQIKAMSNKVKTLNQFLLKSGVSNFIAGF